MNGDGGNREDSGTVAYGGAAIAIVGMAGRFPGAPDLVRFWENLRNGVESISRFEPQELEDNFSPEERQGADYVPARGILENVDQFDAEFFGMHHITTRVLLNHKNYVENVTSSPYFAGIIAGSIFWVGEAWLMRLLPG